LGIDRFLNEARAVTNLIGNGIGTIAIAKWDNSFDAEACEREMAAMKSETAARKALVTQK
jgi:aerobic C4-dicarboxylate transport protein